LTKFLVLNFHAKHQIFNGLNTWLLGAVNKFSKNNRSIVNKSYYFILILLVLVNYFFRTVNFLNGSFVG